MSDLNEPQYPDETGQAAQRPSQWAAGGPSGPRATFGQRAVAALIDGVIIFVIFGVLWLTLRTAGYVISIFLGLAYTTYFEAGPAGQTPGKRVMGIRVIRYDTGGPLGWSTSLLRSVIRQFVSSLLCGLGYFWMLWDKEKQTWHDKLSSTVVVPVSAYPPPPNSFGQPPQP